jgi:hypothetical protein
MTEFDLPNYMLAADNHNIGNGNVTWTNPNSWAEKLGNVGKFIAGSVLSGTNSFYNTGVTVGNWLGANNKERDTAEWITSFDNDLGKYYRENTQAVDLGGFVLGSLVPGIAGVKALRYGQAALGNAKIFNAGGVALKTALAEGKVGGTMGRSLGLLVDRTDEFLGAAAAEINASTTALKLINANTTRALASGFWQNTLEAAAFETMVQATMFRSPILEQQDGWDIAQNIALGGAVGGVIGGAFGAAKLRGTLKSAVAAEDAARFPFINRFIPAERTPSSNAAIQYAADIEFAPVPVRVTNAEGITVNNFEVSQNLYNDRVRKGWNGFRESTIELAGKDKELGNVVANISMPALKDGVPISGFAQNIFENYSGAVRILRPLEQSAQEIRMGKAILKGVEPEELVAARYVKLFGDDAGKVVPDQPIMPTLGDLYAGKDAVLKAVRKYEFTPPKDGVTWSVLNVRGDRGYLEAEARYLWASKVLKEIPDGAVIGRYDIPLLERAYFDNKLGIKVVSDDGLEITEVLSRNQLYQIIKESKEEAANYILYNSSLKRGGHVPIEQGTEAAARIVNTRQAYLEGLPSGNEIDDLFQMQGDLARYQEQLTVRGLSTGTSEVIDPAFLPKYAKVVYAVDDNLVATTPHILDAMTFFAEQNKMYQEGAKRVVARVLGPLAEQIPDISTRDLATATRVGTGAGLVTSDASAYGSLGSKLATTGAITREAKQVARKNTADALQSALVKLGGKQEAAFEFEAVNQKITRSGQLWMRWSDDGAEYMVTKRALDAFAERENITGRFDERIILGDMKLDYDSLFAAFPEDLIQLKNAETVGAIDAHITTTGKRTQAMRDIRAQQGKTDAKLPDIYRPIRPDLRNYPHFAFVVDLRVTEAGHKTMIHAASEKELAAMIDKVPSQYRTITKTDTEEFFKARGEYEYSRTLNENYLNSDLTNAGVFSNFFPKSDPQKIIDDVLQQNFRESDVLVSEAVRLRNEAAFSSLEDMGKQYSKIATSRFASRADLIERTADNPFFNDIKTALDITKINEHPLIYGFNKLLDESVSKAVGAIRDTFTKVKSPAQLDLINAELDKFGMKPAYYDASLQALANHTAPRGELTKFVRGANALLSQFTLGLDPLNALNNAIGSNILRMTELKHLTRAIEAGDSKLAGELSALTKVATPGAPAEVFAPTKLVSNAIKQFWTDKTPALAKYKEMGLIKSRAEQLKMLVDDFTLKGTETVSELNERMGTAFARAKGLAEVGENLTGNSLAEEFNRFISANVMDQLTDLAVKRGIMDDATARTYIRTFVNRVEGNIIASQRPLIFQGPIGQAVSLFQSYQFNLLQQLFRYVGEGKGKDLAMLAGLQSTLYGVQSMPAFQFMNVHIIGQASGNTEHRDTYDAIYGIAGRTAGDWILYGIPSNILQTNIYSRGDINPRHLTILPTTLQEIPLVQGWGKFLGSMYETSKRIAGGGAVWESLLQGVEHNGVSRPLAGFAQTLQALGPDGKVYSTSSKGTILYQNDLLSLATLTRLAGGRPIDEAVVNDSMYRVKAYEAARRKDMASLTETIKGTLIQGNQATEEQLAQFAQQYAESGGKQKGFNKYMMDLYRSANTSQAEQIQGSLSNPFSYKVQLLMGGDE